MAISQVRRKERKERNNSKIQSERIGIVKGKGNKPQT
jgi:hypothetical protein